MTYEQMLRKIQTAGVWFVGTFMGEFLIKYDDYTKDTANRIAFINYIHTEYGEALGYSLDSSKTKSYALMSIIKEERTLDALEHVISCNENKVPADAIDNAMECVNEIAIGKIKLP